MAYYYPMPRINVTTFVAAPTERVFDLSRSIDLHRKSMQQFSEEPVQGKRNGLISEGEDVTWKAKHLLKTRFLKVKVTFLKKPEAFTDEQVEGDFKMMKHEHIFKPCDNGTIMIDIFHFETPYGFFGKMINKFYLTRYMQTLLEQRNKMIKETAESNQWKNYLTF